MQQLLKFGSTAFSRASTGKIDTLLKSRTLMTYCGRPHKVVNSLPIRVHSGGLGHSAPLKACSGALLTRSYVQFPELMGKRLENLVNLDLLKEESTERIGQIWLEYHVEQENALGETLDPVVYDILSSRTEVCPTFVYPVVKPDNSFFVLLGQWQGNICMFTFLEDYQRNPANAEPYLAFHLYDDILENKKIVLMRCEISPLVTKGEAQAVVQQFKHFYLGDGYEDVQTFNQNSTAFDFNKVFPGVMENALKATGN